MTTARFLQATAVPRLAFGTLGMLRPRWLGRACGMRPEHITEETEFLMRAFATRDFVLALQHLAAARRGEDQAAEALGGAAATGFMDGVSIVCDIAQRGEVRGAMRAGAVFAVTDGIGLPVAHLIVRRRRRAAS